MHERGGKHRELRGGVWVASMGYTAERRENEGGRRNNEAGERSRLSSLPKIDRFDNLEAEAGDNTIIIKQVITIVMHRNELHTPVRTSCTGMNLTRQHEALTD